MQNFFSNLGPSGGGGGEAGPQSDLPWWMRYAGKGAGIGGGCGNNIASDDDCGCSCSEKG